MRPGSARLLKMDEEGEIRDSERTEAVLRKAWETVGYVF
jgi:chorismate mutase